MEGFFLWIFTLVAVIAGSFGLLYAWSMKKFRFWKDRGICHKEPVFPYGNTKGISRAVRFSDILTELYYKYQGKEKFVGLYMFMKPVGMVSDPDLIKQILVKDFHNFQNRGLYHNEKHDPLSGHLFTLEGEPWRILRAKVSPTFTSGKIKMMFNIMVEVTNELKRIVDEELKVNNDVDISDTMARFTMDIIGNCAFGIECNALKNPNEELMVFGKKFFNPGPRQILRQIAFSVFPELSRKLGVRAIEEDVSSFFMRVITETVRYREQNGIVRSDFMDLMLRLKNSGKLDTDDNAEKSGLITLNELAAQCFVFFLAGFETSSTTISFSLYELALNPDIQERLRKEILQCLEETNGVLTYEAVMGMKYLEKVINGESFESFLPCNKSGDFSSIELVKSVFSISFLSPFFFLLGWQKPSENIQLSRCWYGKQRMITPLRTHHTPFPKIPSFSYPSTLSIMTQKSIHILINSILRDSMRKI